MSPAGIVVDIRSGRQISASLPAVFSVDERRLRNNIQQLGAAPLTVSGTLYRATYRQSRGYVFRSPDYGRDIVILPRAVSGLSADQDVLMWAAAIDEIDAVDLTAAKWARHPARRTHSGDRDALIRAVRASWTDAFEYIEQERALSQNGMRRPQLGALHSIHAHWSVSNAPATIVLPTGTGKTETMLATLVSAQCEKLLVLVPSDALRTQIVNKFASWGGLKSWGVLPQSALNPIVATLAHVPRSIEEVDEIFGAAQVIVTTSAVAGRAPPELQERIVTHCSHLFIDEAHHAEAPTWAAFKGRFAPKPILQFTATPFREDGQPLDGEIIYKYPLRKAQEEDYFRPINFEPVIEFNPQKADAAIAERAIAQLRADADKGHILMARVDSIERAREVFALYEPYAEFHPVQLHTGVKSAKEREAIRQSILNGTARIIVCVDMLGEGFDLPTLKIAAFHDIRKGLAVTLQLAGRFTRARADLGSATFIANTADVIVRDELRKLYAREPDWNVLLGDLSENLIGEQQSLQDFLRDFTEFDEDIPLRSVRAATSAVVYKTTCEEWSPANFRDGIPNLGTYERVIPTINDRKKTLVIVTAQRVDVPWTNIETLPSWDWNILIVHWWKAENLLFINSSSNAGEYKSLATAIAGDDVQLISGQDVFRVFSGVHRLRLQQVGLTEILGRNHRYTGRMGPDVGPTVTDLQRRRTRKALLAGTGYEEGEKVTVAASRKGRIWSMRRENLDGFLEWCHAIGTKLVDEAIDPDEVLSGTLSAEIVAQRPASYPLCADWPEEIYKETEATWRISWGGRSWNLSEVSIDLVDPSIDGPLTFALTSEEDSVELALELFEREDDQPDFRFAIASGESVTIRKGDRSTPTDITTFFSENPPVIWFANGAFLEGNEYVELKHVGPPFDTAKIDVWDWKDIDLSLESQGDDKNPASIQARVISELKTRDYSVIVDDDGKGELADVVAIRLVGDRETPSAIDVELYHCKYSSEPAPGHRIKDLYEVCGQAQKSVSWMSSGEKQSDIFTHLMRRDAQRRDVGRPTRFEVGSAELVSTIREISRVRPVNVRIFVVQPGVSKGAISNDQMRLLSVTENYLIETYQLPFRAIVSA